MNEELLNSIIELQEKQTKTNKEILEVLKLLTDKILKLEENNNG